MAPAGVRTARPLEVFAVVLPLIHRAQAFSFPSVSAVRQAGSGRRTLSTVAAMAMRNEGPHFVIGMRRVCASSMLCLDVRLCFMRGVLKRV